VQTYYDVLPRGATVEQDSSDKSQFTRKRGSRPHKWNADTRTVSERLQKT